MVVLVSGFWIIRMTSDATEFLIKINNRSIIDILYIYIYIQTITINIIQ